MPHILSILLSCLLLFPPFHAEAIDTPRLNVLLSELDTRNPTMPPDVLKPYLGEAPAIQLSSRDMDVLLTATADDSLTLLRATALFAGWVKKRGISVFVEGRDVQTAVQRGYALGLTFPVDHLAYICFVPNPSMGGDFQAHIRTIYTRQYTYPFDEDIFNANVLIQGREIIYGEEKNTGYLVTTDVYDDGTRALYTNVEGILGQKRGVLGFFQKMFFFVPKTLNGLELTDGDLIIDAFINQTIDDFEHEPRYRVVKAVISDK